MKRVLLVSKNGKTRVTIVTDRERAIPEWEASDPQIKSPVSECHR